MVIDNETGKNSVQKEDCRIQCRRKRSGGKGAQYLLPYLVTYLGRQQARRFYGPRDKVCLVPSATGNISG